MTEVERRKANDLFEQSTNTTEQFSKVGIAFRTVAKEASDWEEAHQGMQKRLKESDASPIPRYLREQIAALSMFRTFFTDWEADLSEEQREAVGHYTKLLVENRSPESPFVLSGLEKLEGHWPDAKVVEYADIARRSAEDTYGASGQMKASSENVGTTPGLEAAKRRRTENVLEANKELQRMVQRLSTE
jgi:hypothetical protein